jgi:hypothetical protein
LEEFEVKLNRVDEADVLKKWMMDKLKVLDEEM